MSILDDVLSHIASAVGPRGVDVNDANMGLTGVRPRPGPGMAQPMRSPTASSGPGAMSPTSGMAGNRSPFPGTQPNPTPDDRYGAQRRAAEYADPHDATQHLQDPGRTGAVTGTVKSGGESAGVQPGYGAAPPANGAAATPHVESVAAKPVSAGSMLRVPQYQPPDMAARERLEQQRSADMVPTDRNAPGIKPGWGRRIGGMLLGMAAGFGRNGGDPDAAGKVASSVINAKYNRAEDARQAALNKVNQQIADFDMDAKARQAAYEQQLKGFKAASDAADENRANQEAQNVPKGNLVLGPDKKTAGYYTASGKFVAAPMDDSKPGKETEVDKANDRATIATKLGLKGEARTMYIANGHLPKEFQAAKGDNGLKGKDLVRWNIWTKEHHREPQTEAEVNEALNPKEGVTQRGTPAQFAKVEEEKKKALQQAESDFSDNLGMIRSIKDPQQRAAREREAQEALQKAKDAAQSAYEQQIVALGGSVSGNSPQPQGGQQSAKAQPAKTPNKTVASAHKVGDVVTVRGQKVRITKVLPNGKYEGVAAE